MTKIAVVFTVGASLSLALALGAVVSAQKQQQLFISLIGADGKPVEGLQAGDVGITENDVSCKVVKLEPIDWPTKLQVLVDNGRTNTTPINPLRDGLKALFEQLPEGTEMSLYTTGGSPRPVVKPTTDKQKVIAGIGLIAPDNGSGAFFDALVEAADRAAKDKEPGFAVILMVGSDLGNIRVLDQEYKKLQQTVIDKGITVHITVTAGGGTTNGGQVQTDVGLAMTKLSGGKYETFSAVNRLATLLPELGQRIAASAVRQRHQYRVTYERPDKPAAQPRIGATVTKAGDVQQSLRGNLP
jgi:hypothetical protein